MGAAAYFGVVVRLCVPTRRFGTSYSPPRCDGSSGYAVIMMRWLTIVVLAVIVVSIGVVAGAVVSSAFADDRIGVVVPLDSSVR